MIEVLRSGQLSLGPRVPAFEEAFAARLGAPPRQRGVVRHRRRCTSRCGRSACTDGDEVVTSPFSFVASANAIALRARDARCSPTSTRCTLNLDPDAAAAAITDRTTALLPVHIFGYPADMPALERHGLPIVEDACEALGAVHADGVAVGGRGHPAVFGFYANKQLTTGEGGMLTLGSDEHKVRDRLRAQPGPRARHGLARPRPARLQLPAVGPRVRDRARPARAARRHARRPRAGGRLVPRGAGAARTERGLELPCEDDGGDAPRLVRVRRPAAARGRPRRHDPRAARARRAVQAVPARHPPDVASTASASATARASSRSARTSPRARSRCRSSRR